MLLFILFLQFLGSLSVDPRAINVNVLRPKDVQKHNSVINNIEALLKTFERRFNVNKPVYRSQNLEGELANFFLNLGKKFVNKNDDYIRNFTDTLTSLIENYYFRHKFTPIFGDDVALEAYVINNSLNKWHLLTAKDVRANVKEALDTHDTIFHKIIQSFDIFFNESDKKPLEHIVKDLTDANEERGDLAKVIKGALNFIIINRFESLNDETKQFLQSEIKKLIYGYNKLDGFDEHNLNSDVKIRVDKEKAPKITTDKNTSERK